MDPAFPRLKTSYGRLDGSGLIVSTIEVNIFPGFKNVSFQKQIRFTTSEWKYLIHQLNVQLQEQKHYINEVNVLWVKNKESRTTYVAHSRIFVQGEFYDECKYRLPGKTRISHPREAFLYSVFTRMRNWYFLIRLAN